MPLLVLVRRSSNEGQGQVGVDISGDVGLIAEAVAPPVPANHRIRIRGARAIALQAADTTLPPPYQQFL